VRRSGTRALRTIAIDGKVYRYRVTWRPIEDVTTFSAFDPEVPRAPVRFRFPEGPEHGAGPIFEDGVVGDRREPKWSLNLHRPRTAEFLIRLALRHGWAGRELVIENAYDFLRAHAQPIAALTAP
jgi:hypothetical protein